MTKEIKLTQGKYALVDDDDFEWLSKYKWCYCNRYAIRQPSRKLGKRKLIQMHKEIMNTPDNLNTDHINGNGLDNRKCNLRICTHQQNLFNQKRRSNNVSGYKGIRPDKYGWEAVIGYNYKTITLGIYATPEEAAQAYDKKAIKLFGNFAKLNFKLEKHVSEMDI